MMKAGDTADFVSSKVVVAAARAEIREQGFGEVVSDKEMAGVTSATKSHLRISSAALTLFGAIKGHEEDVFIDVEEALREIRVQAVENNRARRIPLDLGYLEEQYKWNTPEEKVMDRLSADLWKRMRMRGLNLDLFNDRLQYAKEQIASGTDGMERLEQALSRAAADATSLDLIPSSQFKSVGGAVRMALLHLKVALRTLGSKSLFNAVAHYGIKKKEPYYLMSGFRHIFVESSMSRLSSSMDHMLLRDVGELTGLWGPGLFSHRQGLSPQMLAIAFRRCILKMLHIWGKAYILDWDETRAFPKLLMKNMTALLKLGGTDAQGVWWDCEGRFQQFYRRQRMFPVTRFGLGEEYQAEDECMEGDTAAPTVHRSRSAVRTKCLPVGAAVRFRGKKGSAVAERSGLQ